MLLKFGKQSRVNTEGHYYHIAMSKNIKSKERIKVSMHWLLICFCYIYWSMMSLICFYLLSKTFMKKNVKSTWGRYVNLKKPSWAPPGWLFGPVWSILYLLIVISFGKVFMMWLWGEISFILVLPFILNLIFNFMFSPIQFRMQNNVLAAIDIFLIWATIVWSMIAIFPHQGWITYIQIPYLIWVSFAMVLQFTITYLNRK